MSFTPVDFVMAVSVIAGFFLGRWSVREDIRQRQKAATYRVPYTKVHKVIRRAPKTEQEKRILQNGFLLAEGPNPHSVAVIKYVVSSKIMGAGDFIEVAHFFPKKEWWNLIGRPEKGYGLDKMLRTLQS